MAIVDLIMPKMGESIMEATILKWEKKVGDTVELDEDVLLIATDKVDTEVPSPVAGILTEILFPEGETVEVGKVIARISSEGEEISASPSVEEKLPQNGKPEPTQSPVKKELIKTESQPQPSPSSNRFYSPLVKSIAKKEGIGFEELEAIPGSGDKGRLTKKDMLGYLKARNVEATGKVSIGTKPQSEPVAKTTQPFQFSGEGNVQIVEMDRMRKLIAEHMVMSKKVSPHVTSFVEADVTRLFNWRNRNKGLFQERYGEKITFTPIFMEAIIRALKDFPMVNSSIDGDRIIVKKDINLGMAAALPSGNLIVPVIHNADRLNLAGLTSKVNDLASRARLSKLKPEEIQGGTFTVTNVGTFGNLAGTPIINQPQVAIMATGAILKKPAVLETPEGDVIAIRQMMMISMSYDHRVVDGILGGSFIRKVADYLEGFDIDREV